MPVRILERPDLYAQAWILRGRDNPLVPVWSFDEVARAHFRLRARYLAQFGIRDVVLGGSYACFFLLQRPAQRLEALWRPRDVDIFLPRNLHPRDASQRPFLWREPPEWPCPTFGKLSTEYIFHPQVYTSDDALLRVATFDMNASQCCVHMTCRPGDNRITLAAYATPFALKFRIDARLRLEGLRMRMGSAQERWMLVRRYLDKLERGVGVAALDSPFIWISSHCTRPRPRKFRSANALQVI